MFTELKKISNIINPYTLLLAGVFIEYFPTVYHNVRPSINIGPVSLYITDIAVIFLALSVFNSFSLKSSRVENSGKGIQLIFLMFFLLACIKWVLQSAHNINSLRILAEFSSAYLFLFFFSSQVNTAPKLRNLITGLIVFLVYIFVLHIYGFATRGFRLHILSGSFITMLGLLYFLLVVPNSLVRLSPNKSIIIKGAIIATYFMVGHRSGLIALMLGMAALMFFKKKLAIKEIGIIAIVSLIGFGLGIAVSPQILSKVVDRASTTFDSQQDTYQGRYYNLFRVYDDSKQHPVIGKPLTTTETRQEKRMKIKKGNITVTGEGYVVTPHNLIFEWLYYYGWIGVILGLSLLTLMVRFFKKVNRQHKNNSECSNLSILLGCSMVHNLFFALTNVTSMSVFSIFFLYLPVVIMIAVNHKHNLYCSAS